tara:strand:+ start:1186 stop:4908 length:3723 start_codon:yes stop_codon:yes gene_type:complete
MSSDYQIDIDAQALDNAQLELQTLAEEEEKNKVLQQQRDIQLQQQVEQSQAEINDPRNKEGGGGIRGVAKEIGAALGGGIQDTASSIVTLPERAIDMFSGEMEEESKTDEGYNAEWDDWFVDEDNPIETKTWWGGALRSLVHFGTMVPASLVALKAAGLGAVGTAIGGVGGSLVRGAAIGATSDVISKYSQEDNGLAILRDRYNFIDTPLSTQEEDHPAMKTLKNVVEGMGIGALFDGVAIVLGKGVKKIRKGKGGKEVVTDGQEDAFNRAIKREQNVNEQISEKAQLQAQSLRPDQYGGYKNKPFTDSWQASPTSNGKAGDVYYQRKRIATDYGSSNGSTDSLHTPVQVERTAMSADMAQKEVERVLKDFMSDDRIQAEINIAKKEGTSLAEKWGYAAEKAREMLEGRNSTDLTTEEFWKQFDVDMNRIDGREVWKSANVVAADLIVGSLMREIRDLGIASRELFEVGDIADIDGPSRAMYEKIVAGLTQIKLSKATQSAEFRGLGARDVRIEVDNFIDETKNAWRIAMQAAGDDADDSLFRAIHEVVSMSDEIHNLTDFDNWVKKTLKGGYFGGRKKTGVLVKELQGMMVNSVLSGPKTPVRAIMGTGSATFLRPFSQVLGATLSGDRTTQRASLAAMNSMIQTIPEAWTLFKSKLNSYWSGDVSNITTRYSDYHKEAETWDILGDWVENSGQANFGDKAAYRTANMARAVNNNSFFTYSTKIMQATDETFGFILGRARAKEKAMRFAMNQFDAGEITEITPDLLKNAENKFYAGITDADGNITDAATLYAKKEATLTTDLEGFAKGLQDAFDKAPWAKPFFLFARTGVNGLTLTAKHTPIVNLFVKEFNDIRFATPDNLGEVAKYGIKTAEDLANAKALQLGRLAIGGSVISMASIHFMNGGLTGNGPADRQKRQTWIDAGYKPRTISIGGVQVGYDSFEPFNLLLSTVADIGDHSQLMGEEWTEDNLQKMAVVVMQAVSSKSYLAGMQQFVDLFAGKPGSWESIIAGLANNTMPMSSLRNELGKVLNPGMKELNSGILQSIRNRNQYAEGLDPEGGLPTKYDMLNGQPIRDWDFPTRMFNMFSPFSINLDQGAGRKLLFESGYDMRMSTYSSPDGMDLSKSPRLRSKFMKAIGDQNLEAALNKLAKDPKVLASIQEMHNDRNSGRREMNPMTAYLHNSLINRIFTDARRIAWAQIKNDPEAVQLYAEDRRLNVQNNRSFRQTADVNNPYGVILPYR